MKPDSSNGSNGSGRPTRGRGGWGRMVLNKNIRSEESKESNRNVLSVENNNKNGSGLDLAARCNGKLQRTKRIDDGDTGDDKDSIASVTIISVPSSIVTPVTTSGTNSDFRTLMCLLLLNFSETFSPQKLFQMRNKSH